MTTSMPETKTRSHENDEVIEAVRAHVPEHPSILLKILKVYLHLLSYKMQLVQEVIPGYKPGRVQYPWKFKALKTLLLIHLISGVVTDHTNYHHFTLC